jgi:hypothetical protein
MGGLSAALSINLPEYINKHKMKQEEYITGELKEIDSSLTPSRKSLGDALAGVKLSVKVLKKQQPGKGISLIVVVENTSPKNTKLANPMDSLQIIILDEEGWPLKLPVGRPPRVLINTKDPAEFKRSFEIVSIKNSLDEPDLINLADDEQFILKAKTTYYFEIRISHFQNINKENYRAVSRSVKKISKGIYKIKLTLPIYLTDGSNVFRMCESEFVNIEIK